MIEEEFEGKSIVCKWGNQKAYKIRKIRHNAEPSKTTFDLTREDSRFPGVTSLSITEYFKGAYGITLRQK